MEKLHLQPLQVNLFGSCDHISCPIQRPGVFGRVDAAYLLVTNLWISQVEHPSQTGEHLDEHPWQQHSLVQGRQLLVHYGPFCSPSFCI